MLNLIYLTYQSGYDFLSDENLLNWIKPLNTELQIKSIAVIDNFNKHRRSESFRWNNISATISAGNNTSREFSGYLRGLSISESDEGITIILNDTFLSKKHHPRELLRPAILNACRELERTSTKTVFGEINRGPVRATFDGESLDWISSYCILFSNNDRSTLIAAMQSATEEFKNTEHNFNARYIKHIDRQIANTPSSTSPESRQWKIKATAAEMRLSRKLLASGLKLKSIYAISTSPQLFIKYTAMRIGRKFAFFVKAATQTANSGSKKASR